MLDAATLVVIAFVVGVSVGGLVTHLRGE